MIVTRNGSSTAVIQDVETYERTQWTTEMMKCVTMGMEDAAKGRTFTTDEVFSAARKRVQDIRESWR